MTTTYQMRCQEWSLYIKPFPRANVIQLLLSYYRVIPICLTPHHIPHLISIFLESQVVKAVGVWYVFYFVITIFFCSFYLLNLVLAVVYLSYEKELQSLEQEVSEINSLSTHG